MLILKMHFKIKQQIMIISVFNRLNMFNKILINQLIFIFNPSKLFLNLKIEIFHRIFVIKLHVKQLVIHQHHRIHRHINHDIFVVLILLDFLHRLIIIIYLLQIVVKISTENRLISI